MVRKVKREDINKSAEPILVFILIIITLIAFLIYGAGIKNSSYIYALNAMINLLNFGALLIIITLLLRISNKIK